MISFLVYVADSVVSVRVLVPLSPLIMYLFSATVSVGISVSSMTLASPETVTVPSAAISTFPLLTSVVTVVSLSGSFSVNSISTSGLPL